jgi:hypothetical protein
MLVRKNVENDEIKEKSAENMKIIIHIDNKNI